MKKHNFHMIISKLDYERLNNIKNIKNFSFSKKINYIIKFLTKFIDVYHYTAKERNSTYKIVNKEGKKNIHIYLEINDYRKFKKIKSDLNFYSMAQVFRFVINKFLLYFELYGFKEFKENVEYYGKLLIRNFIKNNNGRKKTIHMSDKIYYFLGYNKNFSQIFIKLLNIT
ncbi:MAG: hypothetical protein JXB50_01080 [Spirochaetes bacterium]|nr:hypothetical protein [Spirochaetota bacterium]